MPPGLVATGSRPVTKPPKPPKVRYFKGKAPDAAPSDSDSDEEEEVEQQPVKPERRIDPSLVAGGAGRVIPDKPVRTAKDVKVELGGVQVGRANAVKKESDESEEEYETDEDDEAAVSAKAGAADAEDSSEYETDSEEESEEDVKPAHRPVFVPKNKRGVTQEKLAAEAEEKQRQAEEMEAQRKLDSKELAGETIRREIAEREATEIQPDVDDTDGLDPAAEFDEWRARELGRLLRDKQAQAERDEEREEIERRRAMPEEQRLAEDLAHAAETRAKEKSQMGFLQKYYHKGAFHQEDELLNRDYMGATNSAVDMSMLPKVMQVRDFGKMSRSKYTHLTDQDTTQGGWGAAARHIGSGGQGQQQGCWNCGGPHLRKDCPNDDLNNPNRLNSDRYGSDPTGQGTSANGAALGSGSRTGRGWGRDGEGDRSGGDRYRQEGRERRFEEERRLDDRPDGRNGGNGRGYGEGTYDERDRDRRPYDERPRDNVGSYERDRRRGGEGYGRAEESRGHRRSRSRSRSPGRGHKERDREDDRDRRRDEEYRRDGDGRRERDRDRGDDGRRRYD